MTDINLTIVVFLLVYSIVVTLILASGEEVEYEPKYISIRWIGEKVLLKGEEHTVIGVEIKENSPPLYLLQCSKGITQWKTLKQFNK